jgi:predicted alpha/beta-hydrolase family hydrolase
MPSAKLVIGGAAATTALGIRVARSLYARWRLLPEPDRRRIESLAEDLKTQALALRGAQDRTSAQADLFAANESFAAALVETAEADPELDEVEVGRLREDLRRELERLASADVKAWRTRREATPPPG